MDTNVLIQKWLTGELSEEERKAFDALEEASFYKDIVEDASYFKASNFSEVNDFATFKDKYITETASETKVIQMQWFQPVLRIASVVVVAFGLYFAFLYNSNVQVETAFAEKTTFQLPDATQVTLNAQSEVSYSSNDWDDNREIELKGEAFFDVAKGAKFDVLTDEGTVSVLGTEFNVKQRGSLFEVTCYEGTVRVVSNGITKILKAGDDFQRINGEIITGKNRAASPSWTNSMSYFKRLPVTEVFAELERQYNVKVQAENISQEQLFTGGFGHKDLDSALKAVSEPLGLDYQILKDDMVRFSKRE